MTRSLPAAAVLSVLGATPAALRAAEPVPPASPPPAVAPAPAVPTAPASPQPVPYQSPHGLFLQAGLGGGGFFGANDVSEDRRAFSGFALSWQLLLGGTLHRRWAGGAGVSREHVPSPRARDELIDGDEPNLDEVTLSLTSLVAFMDFHPSKDGFHAHGQLGFGTLSADRRTGVQAARDAGVVVALGAGYDFPLEGGLSVGALAQVSYSRQEIWESQFRPVKLDLFFPSVMLTAAYR